MLIRALGQLGGHPPLDGFGPEAVYGPMRWPRGSNVVPIM